MSASSVWARIASRSLSTPPSNWHIKKPPAFAGGFFQRVDNPTPLSFRTSDRCHWCGNPYLFRQEPAKSAGFVRFRNGLPRQCVPQGHLLRGAHWLAMTGFFYPWDTVPGAQWAFLNTVSGAEMTTLVLSATEPVRNALPPTTECSPITVSPPRMDAPE